MRRKTALGILSLLVVLALIFCLLAVEDKAVLGRWETTLEVAGVAAVEVDFTFDGDGVYTCAIRAGGEELTLRGHYMARRGKLFLSDGLDYKIDPKVYDTYKLEGDILTIQNGSGGGLDGLFPLELKRTA